MVFLQNADKDRDDSLSNGSENSSNSTVSKEEVRPAEEQSAPRKDVAQKKTTFNPMKHSPA